MRYTKQNKAAAYDQIKEFRGTRIVASIKSVSQSGMSRRISFYVHNSNGFFNINYLIAPLLGYSYNQKGIRVDGAGMDMIFAVLSNLNYEMARLDGKYDELKQKGERIYDTYFVNASNYRLL